MKTAPVSPPEAYVGPLLWGTEVRQVEPGTVVRHPITGEEAVVEEGTVVTCGWVMYLTPTMFSALATHPMVRDLTGAAILGESDPKHTTS